ncbi:Jerky [Araneus ventricosus]|uniref:Jerky n=1 Tax=Araneus ventricosus TaxID=182803 RepID=A0A4Y2WPF0_ARAVE|nr:Jerky [Araneus ventricosus]
MPKRALSSTVASGTKRKHVTLSIKDKVNLIKKLESGTAVAKLCEEYGLGKSTIYDIKKQKKELFEFFADSDTPMAMGERKIIRHAKNDDHDRVMIEWVRQRRSEGVPLSGPLLMEQAKIFHRSMNLTTDYSYTTGWLTKFKKRHGIRQLKICGDRASANAEAAEDFVNEFVSLVETKKLSQEQIYNVDETGLFWRYVPRSTLATADKKDATGVKDSKERITILGCGNAAGSHKTKLFVIRKSAKPRAFKNVKVFPVIYQSNKRAWMTQHLMNEWFENHFVPEACRHLSGNGFPADAKILLILDNCTAHLSPEILVKDNVSVLFFPPNCISLIQPMDMGILRALKCQYKSEFLKEMLSFLNGGETLQNFLQCGV